MVPSNWTAATPAGSCLGAPTSILDSMAVSTICWLATWEGEDSLLSSLSEKLSSSDRYPVAARVSNSIGYRPSSSMVTPAPVPNKAPIYPLVTSASSTSPRGRAAGTLIDLAAGLDLRPKSME